MGHLFSTVDCFMTTFGQTILWVTLTPTAKSSLCLFKTVYNIYKDVSMLQMTSRHFHVITCQRPIFMQPSFLAKAVKNADQQEQKKYNHIPRKTNRESENEWNDDNNMLTGNTGDDLVFCIPLRPQSRIAVQRGRESNDYTQDQTLHTSIKA